MWTPLQTDLSRAFCKHTIQQFDFAKFTRQLPLASGKTYSAQNVLYHNLCVRTHFIKKVEENFLFRHRHST